MKGGDTFSVPFLPLFLQRNERRPRSSLTPSLASGTNSFMMMRWLLKKGSEKKFRFGHPWVFSSELAQSPKGVEAGGLIELRDFQGSPLAVGYGHPNSMISFRVLSLDAKEAIDAAFFEKRFANAYRARVNAGVSEHSHRFIFAEGDFLPGLIIDRFLLENGQQVFVLQSSTAGIDRLLPHVMQALESFANGTRVKWEQTSVVFANDSKSRALEGIDVQPKTVVKAAPGFKGEDAVIVLQPPIE